MFVRRMGSSVRLATSAVVAPRTFSSSKDKKPGDQINSMQSLWNLASDVGIPGIEKIGPRPCTSSVLLEKVKKHIEGQNYVQRPNCCLFEVARIVDDLDGKDSFLDIAGLPDDLTSKSSKKIQKYFSKDALDFVLRHKHGIQADNPITTKEFVVNELGHSILSGAYISASELQVHFETTEKPVYSFCQWDTEEDKMGYSNHVILVLGIDTAGQVTYYDVSDKLNTSRFSRFREMDIEDFNQARISLAGSSFFRNHVFFRE